MGFAITGAARAADAAATDSELQEVVVTGTRITNPNFTSPTPVSVISAETIELRAPAQVNEVINQLPAFRVSVTPNGSGRGASLQSGLQASLDLRGLAPERTLILIDGNRSVGTTQRGFLDTNMIPVSLIERVDVVTGGASAAYGSDAVAGVVNFILNDKLKGFRATAQTGATLQYNDAKSQALMLAGGTDFAGGRGHAIVGIDLANSGGAGNMYSRSWGRREPGLVGTSVAQRNALGVPAQLFAYGVQYGNAAPGGLITTAASNGNFYAFDTAGTPYVFTRGSALFSGAGAANVTTPTIGNTGAGINPNSAFLLANRQSRRVGYGRATYSLTDDTEVYVEANYGRTELPAQRDGFITTNVIVPRTSLPTSIQSLYTGTNVTIGRINLEDGGGDLSWQTTTLTRYALGLKGKFAGKWNWNASYQSSRSHEDFNTTGTVLSALFQASYGCNGTATNPNLNANLIAQLTAYQAITGKTCVAFNPLGVQSDAAAAYWHATQHQDIRLGMDSAQGSISGSPFANWAGDVDVALGGEWRHTTLDVIGSSLGAANVFSQGNFGSFGGADNVTEVFGEANLPLLHGVTAAKALDLNAAVRSTDYRFSGRVTTWKAGLTYQPIDALRFRVTQSRDIRAPTTNELFFIGGALPTVLPVTAGITTLATPIAVRGTGNPNLKPEKADTFTTGIIVTPSGRLNGFRASVDYYNVRVKGAIARLSTAQTLSQCVAILGAGGTSCPGITFTGGAVSALDNQSANLNKFVVSGVDIDIGYRLPQLQHIPGQFDVSAKFNRAFHDQQYLTTGIFELANSTQGVPAWSGNVTIGWNKGKWNHAMQLTGFTGVRYDTSTLFPVSTAATNPQTYVAQGTVGPGEDGYLNTNANSISVPRFGGVVYANYSGRFQITDHVELFGVLNNVFDRDPPEFAAIAVTNGNRNINYDILGRAWRFGVRVKY